MVTDWSDRRTCVLFGDGAGAVFCRGATRRAACSPLPSAAMAHSTKRSTWPPAEADSRSPSRACHKGLQYLQMNRRQMLKFALREPMQGVMRVVEAAGLATSDVDLLVPSQSNRRLIEAEAKMLGIPMSKVMVNVDRYANTSAASVAIALCEALEDKRAKDGDNIALMAYGAGLSWAASVIHMGEMSAVPGLIAWPVMNRARSTIQRARVMARMTTTTIAANVSRFLLPFFTSSHKDD